MSSPRFFFHAPDGRVYGPADFATLTRWRAEKRLGDDSRLRQELTDSFLTYAELAARPPAPEPVLPPAPVPAPAKEPVAIEIPSAEAEPILTLPELIRRGFALYRRGFWMLWLVAAVIQTPLFVVNLFFPQHFDPATSLPVWSNERFLIPIFLGALGAALFAELGSALLTNLVRQIEADEPLSLEEAFHGLKGRIFPLFKTWVLRILIIASWLLLAILIYATTSSLSLPGPLHRIIGIVLVFPALLLFLRYLISTQVVMLERLEGLQALRRAGDLVRFGAKGGPFSSGDLRLAMLAMLPWVAIGVATALLSALAGVLPAKILPFFTSALSFVGAATATPLLVILFVLFVIDSRRRLRQPGFDSADPADEA